MTIVRLSDYYVYKKTETLNGYCHLRLVDSLFPVEKERHDF
jgi:hypothetical protein